ncbi:MAG: hypothetical protein R3C60_05360 [Parvularculaceae bacterium]
MNRVEKLLFSKRSPLRRALLEDASREDRLRLLPDIARDMRRAGLLSADDEAEVVAWGKRPIAELPYEPRFPAEPFDEISFRALKLSAIAAADWLFIALINEISDQTPKADDAALSASLHLEFAATIAAAVARLRPANVMPGIGLMFEASQSEIDYGLIARIAKNSGDTLKNVRNFRVAISTEFKNSAATTLNTSHAADRSEISFDKNGERKKNDQGQLAQQEKEAARSSSVNNIGERVKSEFAAIADLMGKYVVSGFLAATGQLGATLATVALYLGVGKALVGVGTPSTVQNDGTDGSKALQLVLAPIRWANSQFHGGLGSDLTRVMSPIYDSNKLVIFSFVALFFLFLVFTLARSNGLRRFTKDIAKILALMLLAFLTIWMFGTFLFGWAEAAFAMIVSLTLYIISRSWLNEIHTPLLQRLTWISFTAQADHGYEQKIEKLYREYGLKAVSRDAADISTLGFFFGGFRWLLVILLAGTLAKNFNLLHASILIVFILFLIGTIFSFISRSKGFPELTLISARIPFLMALVFALAGIGAIPSVYEISSALASENSEATNSDVALVPKPNLEIAIGTCSSGYSEVRGDGRYLRVGGAAATGDARLALGNGVASIRLPDGGVLVSDTTGEGDWALVKRGPGTKPVKIVSSANVEISDGAENPAVEPAYINVKLCVRDGADLPPELEALRARAGGANE